MPTPAKVFICYQKVSSKKRDGKRVKLENRNAKILHLILSQDGSRFDPWVDDHRLEPGIDWETEIYTQIPVSDVMLALIGPGTRKSDWVRREIALAKALGISIFPLGVDLRPAEMDAELKALGIARLQWKIVQTIKRKAAPALLAELRPGLESAVARTHRQQEEALRGLTARRNPPAAKAADNQRAESFALPVAGRSIGLHIASGDLSKVRGIDVLVNSENDFMQMARYFESRTVSSTLRRRGSRTQAGRYEDVLQNEPQENGARYVFHVAAVQSVEAKATVIPYAEPDQIERCVRRCLLKMAEVNQKNGVISRLGTPERLEQEARAANADGLAHSILFPMFGTGQGGSECSEVISPMLDGLLRFLGDPQNDGLASVLTDVYISAFRQRDLEDLTRILRERFGRAPAGAA